MRTCLGPVARAFVGCSLAATALAGGPSPVPKGATFPHDIRPGAGVTRRLMLSTYAPGLRRTPGDTPVYILAGPAPGGTVLVVGGTHANELAGIVAATVLVEKARVLQGQLIVIPNANSSAVTHRDPERPVPDWIVIPAAKHARRFKLGSRYTNPRHQGAADLERYRHPGSEVDLPGQEIRNLDRAYPGQSDGGLTQRVAAAIMELLRREKVDVAFDLHEAPPGSRLAWMVVAHPRGLELAAMAVVELDAAGLQMKLEVSDDEFRGLSHREWGDGTESLTFLVETPNPSQERGGHDVEPVLHPTYPLAHRVGAHLATVQAILAAYDDAAPEGRVVRLGEVPGAADLDARGLGAFLN